MGIVRMYIRLMAVVFIDVCGIIRFTVATVNDDIASVFRAIIVIAMAIMATIVTIVVIASVGIAIIAKAVVDVAVVGIAIIMCRPVQSSFMLDCGLVFVSERMKDNLRS